MLVALVCVAYSNYYTKSSFMSQGQVPICQYMSEGFHKLKTYLMIILESISIVVSYNDPTIGSRTHINQSKIGNSLMPIRSDLGSQDPSLGTLVPADFGILVVVIQQLIRSNIFAHSVSPNLSMMFPNLLFNTLEICVRCQIESLFFKGFKNRIYIVLGMILKILFLI